MKAILFIILIVSGTQLFAQKNILEARSYREGDLVTVSGVATNGEELGPIRYIQDQTGGLAIYDDKLSKVKRGDSITVSGEVNPYNNLFEVTKVSSLSIHSSNNNLPSPKIVTISGINEELEGQLIQINNVEIVNAGGTFAGDKNYEIRSNGTSIEFRINKNSSAIIGSAVPTGKFNLIAICSQYKDSYQLLPRDMEDFISVNPINITSPLNIKEITNNGFTLFWKTDTLGTSEIIYGTNTDSNVLDKSAIGNSWAENGEYLHEVNLSGLEASSIIYAVAFSVNNSDTAFSSPGTFATQSNSSGKINVYFNTSVEQDSWNFLTKNINPVYKSGFASKGTEDDPLLNIGGAMEDTLIAYINRAEESIDFCMYNFNNSGLSNVSEALNSAKNRGVVLRVITCGSTTHPGTEELNSDIPVLERPFIQDGGIMHNKFVLFDSNSSNPNNSWVLTGSTNISYNQINSDANNMVFIQDQTLAKAFQIEFEEMWGSNTKQPNLQNAKFGADKKDNTPHEFNIGGIRVECFFSPSDNTNQKIINAINTADNDLEIETMLITRTDLATAIRDAHLKGVNTQVITNYAGDNSVTVNDILNSSLPSGKYIFDNSASGMLHHKTAIIDGFLNISDPQVITGSHNWSFSADEKNDENTLIFHSWEIANLYLRQFAARFTENGGNLFVKAKTLNSETIKIYPNPTVGKINISSSQPIERIQLYSISGNLIQDFIPEDLYHSLLDFRNEARGIFLLKVLEKSGNQNTFKIIKK